jgi:cellobiose-specific phosphotransferase system component IIA
MTTEQAAKEAIPYLKGVITNLEDARKLFIAGANWQKEQQFKKLVANAKSNTEEAKNLLEDLIAKRKKENPMYTEVEVIDLIKKYRSNLGVSYDEEIRIYPSGYITLITFDDWFNQNKK